MTFKPKTNILYPSSELGNEEYHSQSKYWSSSQVKDALSEMRTFYKTYITKELSKDFARQTQIAMDIGTYFHAAILEPETLTEECAVWDGVRKGKAYEDFMQKNKGKVVITASDFEKAQALISGFKADPESMKFLSSGEPEVSTFAKIQGLNVRVRADWLDIDRGLIMDLKSTSGSVYDPNEIKKKVDNFNYDLSAAFYMDVFNSVLAKLKKPLIKEFYWVFVSKDTASSQVYKASEAMIELGRKKYIRGLNNIAQGQATGWKFESTILEIDPIPWASQLWEKEEVKPMEEDSSDIL